MRCRGEEGGIFKEGDINRDEVAINARRITTIIPLKARITQEDTLRGFVISMNFMVNFYPFLYDF